ncbi:ATP-binding protein [uncultured Draconibacterium sp.]|uniref:methylation-associated defense system ATP-binding protein MAD8 n=1 Tax=uncultured Draconibacterium sp. TaxID=1573823 RepID=UPI0025D4013E|nr:ATP-binding protein [uncultured Draconibacterium sp.]
MNYIERYYTRIIALVSELYHDEFVKTTPGHCMKITGLRKTELEVLWEDIVSKYPHINTFIVSSNGEVDNTKFISATKLIELRNSEEQPLLILIPANSRTAAEDSYGNATFKEINLEAVETELLKRLRENTPAEYKKSIETILKHPFAHEISITDTINFLLHIEENGYEKQQIGDSLFLLHLLPDSSLLNDKAKVRSRLNLNMQCTEDICNFSKPVFDRISDLPVDKNTIQSSVIKLYNKYPEQKERNKIVELVAQKQDELNFSNWPIAEVNPEEFELFVDDVISREFVTDDGQKVLRFKGDKVKKVNVKIRTEPKPIELEDVRFFRILLMQVDGASGTEVAELRKMKKTATQQKTRKAQVELDPTIIEEGSYFFRVIAEDETGARLNIRDKFKDSKVQRQWEEEVEEIQKSELTDEEKKEKINELLEYEYQFKRTCDSEDFDFELDEGDADEPRIRKEKIRNRLQAYFAFRIDQLKKEEELSIPQLEAESGLWLNDSPTKLDATYYLKYSNSHNYQINIPNKLRLLEWLILENPQEYGRLDVLTRNDAQAIDFKSSVFKPSTLANHFLPEVLRTKREELFKAILNSAEDEKGIFESFDFYNHADLVQEYLTLFTQWTSELKDRLAELENIEDEERIELQNLFVELQNIDTVHIKMRLPNQTPIELQLLTPLHPLRLTWHLQLFHLYTDWEQKTINFSGHLKEWKNLEDYFSGTIFPENNPLAIIGYKDSTPYQYAGELFHNWGIYIKPKFIQEDNTFASINRQVTTYLRNILNIYSENYVDTDINKAMIVRHLKNYINQHPYIDKLIINLFNAGDAVVFANSLVELEKFKEYSHISYEVRLFRGRDNIINHGEGLKELINPESNISEEAESFSQQSLNRLLPKLRFSVSPISDFLEDPIKYSSHISFLVNLFPVSTQLLRVKGEHSNFFMNGVITAPSIQVDETSAEIKWNRFIYSNRISNPINSFTNTGIELFDNIQTFTAGALSNKISDSLPSTQLQLNEKDNVHISLVHDYSDWVITFDRNLGAQAFDQPSKDGHIPFLLDYIPGEEAIGISSFLTTRPNSEILGLLAPHFEEFNISILNDDEHVATSILLEDLRAISSSLVMQINSGKNKAFEVIGSAFAKRVLEKKKLLNESFIIPIDLHQNLFNLKEFESKSRADNMLVRFDVEKRKIIISVLEIKCRSSLSEMDKSDLKIKIREQILNTIEVLQYHFSPDYNLSEDRLDRALKNKELKSFLNFYIERATRYNYLEPQVAQLYLDFINTLDEGFQIDFKQLGFIFDFGSSVKHEKELYDDELVIYSFGEKLIAEILDPDSDLNTRRLEDCELEADMQLEIGSESNISDFIKGLAKQEKKEYPTEGEDRAPILVVKEPPAKEVVPETEPVTSESGKEDDGVIISTDDNEEVSSLPDFDIFIGKDKPTDQYGILGQSLHGKKIAVDLSETNTISLFGVQGGGKSYSIGTVTEMVLKEFKNINHLPSPLAGVIFHYSESMDYEPEFTSMVHPNDAHRELKILLEDYKAEGGSIDDVVILTPKDKVEERQEEYPNLQVHPIAFNSMELNVQDWLFLLGAVGNDSTYVKQLKYIMKVNRRNLTLESISEGIEADELLSNAQKALARQKLNFASEYVDDDFSLRDILHPERLIIVDLRDEFIVKDEALGLFVIMLNIFSGVKSVKNKRFNKFIVFDEAHKYMDNKALTDNIVTAIREMRHKGVSIMIASQDPPSLPNEIIELSSIVITHKFNSPQWLKHIQKSITQLAALQPSDLSALRPGEAFVWATKATDKLITNKPQKVYTRPRVTKHGGGTIKATDN